MAHDVFISYGREDMPLMQQVEKALHEAGLTIWTDRGIAPGSPSWKAEIEKAILDARCIVVLFSPDSAESRWVRAELDYADAQRKPIYPLLVRGDSNKAIPFGFTSYQWIDMRDTAHLKAGLERLIAVLKGEQASPTEAISEKPVTPPARSRLIITFAASLILAGLVLGLALLSHLPQTTSSETPTDAAQAALAPTALPTMPPFAVPDGFKKLEGEKTLLAIPSNWSTNIDPAIFNEALKNLGGTNKNLANVAQTVLQNMDSLGIEMLQLESVGIAIEDMGGEMPYAFTETRQRSIFQEAMPNSTFVSRGLVETPAGTMLVTEVSDSSLFLLSYTLARGAAIYSIYFSGRADDKATVISDAETMIQTFRVKE